MSDEGITPGVRAEIAAATSAWSGPNERTAAVDAALVRVVRALDAAATNHQGKRPKRVDLLVDTAAESTLEFEVGSDGRWTFEEGSWVDEGRRQRSRLLRPVLRGVARGARPEFVDALDVLVRDVELATAQQISLDSALDPSTSPTPGQTVEQLLESVFPTLSETDRLVLLDLTRPLELGAGTTIFVEGAAGSEVLFLLGGTVAVESTFGDTRLRPGSVIGERAPLTGRPRDATVRAITDVVVLQLDATRLDELPVPLRDVLGTKVTEVTGRAVRPL